MVDEIVRRFSLLPATCVADGLRGFNALDWRIKPLKSEYTLCGRAMTVDMPAGDNSAVLKAISQAQPGSVLVVDAKGYEGRAIAGEFVIGLARNMGLSGVVVDGCIRDVVGIRALDFPVFCKGSTTSASARNGAGTVNVPISCGGVMIRPGDIIVGDADGVVSVPREREEEVLAASEQKLAKDDARAAEFLKDAESAKRYCAKLFS